MNTQTSYRRVWRGGSLRGRSGTEVLEMALILPLLLLLAFGTVEFGYWFYLEHNFQAAARDGVRAGIVASLTSPAEREAAANAAIAALMNNIKIPAGKYSTSFEYPTINGANYMTVKVTANWKDIGVDTGLIIKMQNKQTDLVHNNSVMQGVATMRIES